MSATPCPFCGELMSPPVKFCMACGRPITQEDLNRAGLKMTKEQAVRRLAEEGAGRFALSKKEYSTHRQMRNFFISTSTVLVLVISYYFTMKYVLHEHLPFKMDVMLEQFIGGSGNGAQLEPAVSRQAETAPASQQ